MTSTYYDEVKTKTAEAIQIIKYDHEGNYKGYTGGNAVSFYLNENHNINVTCDDTAQRAFNDAFDNA